MASETQTATKTTSCPKCGSGRIIKLKANHAAAISLFVAHFNFCRIHSSIRMTPALKAGVTNRLWTMADLVAA